MIRSPVLDRGEMLEAPHRGVKPDQAPDGVAAEAGETLKYWGHLHLADPATSNALCGEQGCTGSARKDLLQGPGVFTAALVMSPRADFFPVEF